MTTMHSPRPAAKPRPLTIAHVPTSPGRRGGSATHAESSHRQYWRMRRSLRSIPPGDDAAEVCVQRAERRGRAQIGLEGRVTDMIGREPRQCSRGQWVCAHGPVSRAQAACADVAVGPREPRVALAPAPVRAAHMCALLCLTSVGTACARDGRYRRSAATIALAHTPCDETARRTRRSSSRRWRRRAAAAAAGDCVWVRALKPWLALTRAGARWRSAGRRGRRVGGCGGRG